MKKLLSLFILALLPFIANANPVEFDGIYYNLITKGKIAEICNCTNNTGTIIIPETIEYEGVEYTVTKIGSGAFSSCSDVHSVTIPKTIKAIGEGAFLPGDLHRVSPFSIYISDIKAWCDMEYINEGANDQYDTFYTPFWGYHLFYDGTEIVNLEIPNTVESINPYAFYNCISLTSVSIPNSVTSIGNNAFDNCGNLKSITIGTNVVSIGDRAFSFCKVLSSITIPNSVTSIGSYAFDACLGLTSVTFGNNVTSIGKSAFFECYNLNSVTITDLSAWCNISFSTVDSNPLYYTNHLYLEEEEIEDLVIPNNVSSIGNYAFYGCSNLKSVSIHNNVTTIGESAFNGCSSLGSVTIPNSVTRIGNNAFQYCSSLTSITIPNSVSSIGSYAFSGCSNLISANINGNIGEYALSGCENLTTLTIGATVVIHDYAFSYCPDLTDVYYYADIATSMKDPGFSCILENNMFDNSYIEFATLHIPENSIDVFKSWEPWSNFGTIVALDGTAFHELAINVGKNGTVTYDTSNISNTSQTFNIKEGSDVTLTFTPSDGYRLSSVTINNVDKTADVSEGTLTISNVSADVAVNVSFILDGGSDAVTITDAGVATFCSDKDLDFSEVSGLKAYTGAGFNKSTGQLIMLEVTDVPAGTGLLLKGAAGNYEIPEKASSSVYANLLVGVTSATALSQTDGGYTNYILGNGTNGLGFFKVSDTGGNLSAGKAYLRIPTSAAGARTTISLDFSGDASGISDIVTDAIGREVWFNIQGRRLESAPTKAGLYIRNGKKFIVK